MAPYSIYKENGKWYIDDSSMTQELLATEPTFLTAIDSGMFGTWEYDYDEDSMTVVISANKITYYETDFTINKEEVFVESATKVILNTGWSFTIFTLNEDGTITILEYGEEYTCTKVTSGEGADGGVA